MGHVHRGRAEGEREGGEGCWRRSGCTGREGGGTQGGRDGARGGVITCNKRPTILMIEGVSSINKIFFEGSDFPSTFPCPCPCPCPCPSPCPCPCPCPCPSPSTRRSALLAVAMGNAFGKGLNSGVLEVGRDMEEVKFGRKEPKPVPDVTVRNLGMLVRLESAVSSLR